MTGHLRDPPPKVVGASLPPGVLNLFRESRVRRWPHIDFDE